MFPSWWRSLVKLVNRNGKQPRRGRRKTTKVKPSWRPFVEIFEERLVPTTISIPTTLAGPQSNNVLVPIDVDTLNGGVGHTGLSLGSLVVFYDKSEFSINNISVSPGTLDSSATSFNVDTTSVPGQILINFSGVTNSSTAGGTLALMNFHVLSGATPQTSHIDLAADNTVAGNLPSAETTYIYDSTGATYTLTPAPQDNATSLSPYAYGGSDPDDGAINVDPAAATSFSITGTTPITAGTADVFTVTALQSNGSSTATDYSGTVNLISSDVGPSTVVPATATITAGVGEFTATLTTAGNQTITATDNGAYNAYVTGNSGTIVVSAATATHLVVSAPATTVAGSTTTFTVVAEDAYNNTATGYTGTVHFTSSDGHARLPADSTLSAGAATFSATLTTAGSQTLTATDAANSLSNSSGTIAVSPAAATHFTVSAPSVVVAGTSFQFTVTAWTGTAISPPAMGERSRSQPPTAAAPYRYQQIPLFRVVLELSMQPCKRAARKRSARQTTAISSLPAPATTSMSPAQPLTSSSALAPPRRASPRSSR